MAIGKIHHVGYLVKNIEKSMDVFKVLGYEVESDVFFDKTRLSDFVFMRNNNLTVELVRPSQESDIYPLLKTYKDSIYHVCYEVEDIDDAVKELRSKGFLLFRDKQEAPAISPSAEVVFLMHSRMGIVELVQKG